jgi:uncharacterized protein
MSRALVDTGPLVAILARDDQFHDACVEALDTLSCPLYTCWPVLAEAAWLLRSHPDAIQRLLSSLTGAFLRLLPLDETDASAVAGIMERYRRLKPQLADATLIHLAERDGIDTIFMAGSTVMPSPSTITAKWPTPRRLAAGTSTPFSGTTA